jgi:protein involved in polysaccharide export with SLBB domain
VTRNKNWIAQSTRVLCAMIAVVLSVPSGGSAQSPDVTVAGTPQQANDRIRTLTMGSHTAAHDYVIGSGDLLSITVFDVPELSREVRVSQMGSIGIPLVPVRLSVSGLTELQAEQKIAEVLEANGLVTHAEVGVMVKEHKSRPITIVGAVTHPMVYEAERTVTLLEALAEAGGVSNDAGDTVIVARIPSVVEVTDPKPIEEQNAPGIGMPATTEPTPAVPPGVQRDQAIFPSGSEAAQNSNVPANKSAIPTEPSGVHSSNTFTINLNELLESGDTRNNIVLQAGDVITVPHAGIVYVLGAVSRPGGFVLANDRTSLTAMKVLSLAGGLTNVAKLKHAFIIRIDDQGKQTNTEVDLKKILDRESEDIQMRASDVLYIPNDKLKEALIRTGELAIALGSGVALYRLAYK